MLDHGHPFAGLYPIEYLSEEAGLVTERLDGDIATRATLLKLAMSTVPNQAISKNSLKELNRQFNDMIKELVGG